MTDQPAASHPSLEELADLHAGLEPAGAAEHAASCSACAEVLSQFSTVSANLSALPPEQLPADVAARIDTALAQAARPGAGTVVPLESRRARPPGWAAAAAAAVALLAGGAYLATQRDPRHPQSTAGRAAGTGADRAPVVSDSGFGYTATNLAAELPSLLRGRPLLGAAPMAGGAPAAPGPTDERQSSDAPKTAARTGSAPNLAALRTTSGLAACLVRALGPDSGQLLAVDLATFAGTPAVIAAYTTPERPDRIDLYVLDPSCPEGAFRYFARLPKPAG